jgi:cobalt/nickel transport system permease protein
MMGRSGRIYLCCPNGKLSGSWRTSGHLIGGTLAAITFGPWQRLLIMTAVLIIQSFVFQDGGISALGGNIMNMLLLHLW